MNLLVSSCFLHHPLPLGQGYRHATYDEIVQLSSLRTLHLLICIGESTDTRGFNVMRVQLMPGVESVSLLHFPRVHETKVQQAVRLLKMLFAKRRILENLGVKILTNKIMELGDKHESREMHFSRTIMPLTDVSADLYKCGDFITSFSVHNIEADKTKFDMFKSF
jgi:hypothetical protein